MIVFLIHRNSSISEIGGGGGASGEQLMMLRDSDKNL